MGSSAPAPCPHRAGEHHEPHGDRTDGGGRVRTTTSRPASPGRARRTAMWQHRAPRLRSCHPRSGCPTGVRRRSGCARSTIRPPRRQRRRTTKQARTRSVARSRATCDHHDDRARRHQAGPCVACDTKPSGRHSARDGTAPNGHSRQQDDEGRQRADDVGRLAVHRRRDRAAGSGWCPAQQTQQARPPDGTVAAATRTAASRSRCHACSTDETCPQHVAATGCQQHRQHGTENRSAARR